MKHYLAGLLIIGLSLAFLVHFLMIAYYGGVTISEPREWVLYTEIIGMAAFTVSGVIYCINALKEQP